MLRPNFSKNKKFQKNRFSKFKNMPLVVLNPEGELRGPMGSGIPRAGPHPEKLTLFWQTLTLFQWIYIEILHKSYINLENP